MKKSLVSTLLSISFISINIANANQDITPLKKNILLQPGLWKSEIIQNKGIPEDDLPYTGEECFEYENWIGHVQRNDGEGDDATCTNTQPIQKGKAGQLGWQFGSKIECAYKKETRSKITWVIKSTPDDRSKPIITFDEKETHTRTIKTKNNKTEQSSATLIIRYTWLGKTLCD